MLRFALSVGLLAFFATGAAELVPYESWPKNGNGWYVSCVATPVTLSDQSGNDIEVRASCVIARIENGQYTENPQQKLTVAAIETGGEAMELMVTPHSNAQVFDRAELLVPLGYAVSALLYPATTQSSYFPD